MACGAVSQNSSVVFSFLGKILSSLDLCNASKALEQRYLNSCMYLLLGSCSYISSAHTPCYACPAQSNSSTVLSIPSRISIIQNGLNYDYRFLVEISLKGDQQAVLIYALSFHLGRGSSPLLCMPMP
jgi:hypothetical protein